MEDKERSNFIATGKEVVFRKNDDDFVTADGSLEDSEMVGEANKENGERTPADESICEEVECTNDEKEVSVMNRMLVSTPINYIRSENKETFHDETPCTPNIKCCRALQKQLEAGLGDVQLTEAIDEPQPLLIVDMAQLEALMERVVKDSHNLRVEELERLHANLAQCIFRHRKEYDKTLLVQEMEAQAEAFFSALEKTNAQWPHNTCSLVH
uniref:ATPase family AAA domain-containing protein 2-like n=1 Tax=Myxine glutinosa TaxID=7769 RepID=UPI00358E87DF